jgi:hypothetical protein
MRSGFFLACMARGSTKSVRIQQRTGGTKEMAKGKNSF